jgi:ubiquitin-protein ligase
MRRHHHYSLGAKFKSPWSVRLEHELADLKALKDDSTILDFKVEGDPPDKYLIRYNGKSLTLGHGTQASGISDHQEVEITLGSDYPRSRPNIRWMTTILHPNISGGQVCLGNFASNWSPSTRLADIVEILWDFSRLAILNPGHGYAYGGEVMSKSWADLDKQYKFPVDKRPLRDRILPNDVGSSEIRPSGAPDDIVIIRDDSGCQFLE